MQQGINQIMLMLRRRLLVVGGLPNKEKKLGYGGATVLMQNFVDYLAEENVDYLFVQTNRYFRKNGQLATKRNILVFFIDFLINLPKAHCVMLNFSDHATVRLYPLLLRICKAMRKKIVYRKFGGSLDLYLEKCSDNDKLNTFAAIGKADLILLETKKSIEYVRLDGKCKNKIVWFPNVRNACSLRAPEKYEKRFVFISHILDEKGVGDILSVSKSLPNGYTIDLYGPIKERKYENFDWSACNVNYGGVLTSEEVLSTLVKYNLLLLTSYREGYPGIIIEAMSVGVPALTTKVGGIPEIVEDGKNGILVEAGNCEQIREAILSVTQESYQNMSQESLQRFAHDFESEATNSRILNEISKLAN